MRWVEASVPLQKRAAVWISSVVIGVAMYLVFASILTAGPAREREEVRGRIEAIVARSLAAPAKLSARKERTAAAEGRAANSLLGSLHNREADLGQECRAKRSWAVLIGLVAGGGGFALCSVHWLRRGTRDATVPGLGVSGT